LIDFMPLLSGETKSGLFSQIVDSARAVSQEELKGRAVAAAAKFASSEIDARNLIREALDIAQTLADDYKRTILLIDIASNLPDAPESREALRQARDSAMKLAQDHPQGAHILTRLAAHLPEHQPELISRAFELAAAIPDLDARGQAFAGLVENLSGAQRITALRCILERCSRIPRANSLDALAALAPIVAQEGGDGLVLSTIEAIQRVAKWWP
jgi:hypothetical protein